MLVLSLVMPTNALAELDDPPKDGVLATTTTHPDPGPTSPGYGDLWWRMGWGNSLNPQFSLYPPESVETSVSGSLQGIIYDVNRDLGTDLDEADPWQYYRATYGGSKVPPNKEFYGTNLDNTLDLLGIYANPPGGAWPVNVTPGVTHPIEGLWYYHYNFYTDQRVSTRTLTNEFGMDITPPDPVQGLSVSTGIGSPPVNGNWVSTSRAYITWTANQYDALSGVGYYQVLVDGNPLIPETDVAPEQGRVYDIPGLPLSRSITVENMPPGEHEISIVTVDRATNQSVPSASVMFRSDSKAPTVEWSSPAGTVLGPNTLIAVNAEDDACDPVVEFSIDGVVTETISAPPYAFMPDLDSLTAGNHFIQAKAIDDLGRYFTISKTVSVDSMALLGFVPTSGDGLNSLSGTSMTNPNKEDDTETWWREGWGNSLRPQFTLDAPNPEEGEGLVIGMLYALDRSKSGAIDGTQPERYYRSTKGSGTLLNETIDLQGIFNYPPVGGWPANEPGATSPLEGSWWLHLKFFTSKGFISSKTLTTRVGVDLTRPTSVTGVTASPSLDPADAGTWSQSGRAHITWNPGNYDALSGVAYYELLVDDKPYVPESESSPYQGRVYELSGITPSSITVEDMPAGKHRVSIRAVDRATNKSGVASTYFFCDPDEPAPVAITSPVVSKVGASTVFSAATSDAGGIETVEFEVDGVTVGTDTTAPYSITPNLTGLVDGVHELKVTATDMAGRQTESKKTFVLDSKAPAITGVVGSASTFYPAQRDGYLDDAVVSFGADEAGTATLAVKNSAGAVVRTITQACAAGANRIVWDGRNSGGAVVGGAYTMTLTYADAVGNKALPSAMPVVVKAKTDEIAPRLTSVKGNRTTFFPRKRDGYKDNLTVKFKANEAGIAKLTIKNSKGKVCRVVTKSVSRAGSSSITWNGKYTSGKVYAGTFTYKLTYADASGNGASSSSRKVKIKFFELAKTARNKLKLVQR